VYNPKRDKALPQRDIDVIGEKIDRKKYREIGYNGTVDPENREPHENLARQLARKNSEVHC
jgi:hypothetical protein